MVFSSVVVVVVVSICQYRCLMLMFLLFVFQYSWSRSVSPQSGTGTGSRSQRQLKGHGRGLRQLQEHRGTKHKLLVSAVLSWSLLSCVLSWLCRMVIMYFVFFLHSNLWHSLKHLTCLSLSPLSLSLSLPSLSLSPPVSLSPCLSLQALSCSFVLQMVVNVKALLSETELLLAGKMSMVTVSSDLCPSSDLTWSWSWSWSSWLLCVCVCAAAGSSSAGAVECGSEFCGSAAPSAGGCFLVVSRHRPLRQRGKPPSVLVLLVVFKVILSNYTATSAGK